MTLVQRLVVGVFVGLTVVRADAQVPVSLPVLPLDIRMPGAAAIAADRLSMATGAPIRVRDALRLLVLGTRFSVVVAPGVRGTFAGDLRDVTLQEALDAVLRPRRLGYRIDGSVIRVYPRRIESRFFPVDFVDVRRTWQRTLQQGEGAALSTAAGTDPFDDIEQGVDALLSHDGRAHVDRRGGLVSVSDYPEQLDRIAAYVDTLQARALRQVRVQARLVDASAKTTLSLLDLVSLNNEPVSLRTTIRDGAVFAVTIVALAESRDAIQLSVSPSWSDGTARAGASDVVSRVRNGGTLVVPLAEGLTVEVTATIAGTP